MINQIYVRYNLLNMFVNTDNLGISGCINLFYFIEFAHSHSYWRAVSYLKGSKDGLCPLEKLEAVRKKMNTLTALHVIKGGDHSFKVSKRQLQSTGSNQEEQEEQAVEAVSAFVSQHLKERWRLNIRKGVCKSCRCSLFSFSESFHVLIWS